MAYVSTLLQQIHSMEKSLLKEKSDISFSDLPAPHKDLGPVCCIPGLDTAATWPIRQFLSEADVFPTKIFYLIWPQLLQTYVEKKQLVRRTIRTGVICWELAACHVWERLQLGIEAQRETALGPEQLVTELEFQQALHTRAPASIDAKELAMTQRRFAVKIRRTNLAGFYSQFMAAETADLQINRLVECRVVAYLATLCHSPAEGLAYMQELKRLLLARLDIPPDAF